jgi:apolipoprotein N-acyltransferase
MRPAPLVILSSLLFTLSYPTWFVSATGSFALSPLIWVTLLPWLMVLHQGPRGASPHASKKHLFFGLKQGIWFSVLTTLGSFYWVALAIHRYGQVPLPVGFLGLILFGLFNQIQFIIFGALYAYGHRAWTWASPLFWAAAYTLIDGALPKLFQDSLGHSQWNLPWIRSWAAVAGVSCITFMIVWVQLLCARALRKRLMWALGGMLAFVLMGWHLYSGQKDLVANAQRVVPLAILQANIGDFEKVSARLGYWSGSDHILNTHFEMGDQALKMQPRPKALIWAETAYPSAFRVPHNSRELAQDQKMETYVRTRKVPLWFGGYDAKNGKDYNGVFFLSPFGEPDLAVYHKHVLLPFGETIPFMEDGGFLKAWIPNMGFFGRGPGPQVFELPLEGGEHLKVAPIICYEALIESYTRAAALKGAEVFLNVTNDSWFGDTAEPHLHMVLTIFRSIETGLSQIRATNTGISIVSDAAGRLIHRGPVFESAVLPIQVPVTTQSTPTVYVRGGGIWFLWILGLILVGHVGHRSRFWTSFRLSKFWSR